jgi:hypothetical protein
MIVALAYLTALVGLGARADALPFGPDQPVVGVLEEVDFIHRMGRFRTCPAGKSVEFALTPEATVEYVNADADLRDLPLGTAYAFTLERDPDGRRHRVTLVRDQFTADTQAGITYRVDQVNPTTGTLRVVPLLPPGSDPKEPAAAAPVEFRINARTRIWKDDRKLPLAALEVGEEIRVNRGGVDAAMGVDIWVGRATQAAATSRQQQRYAAFLKARGLPARVERTQGQTLTLSVFGGEPATSEATWPGDSSRQGRGVRVAVANDELRTWNPPVDHEGAKIV